MSFELPTLYQKSSTGKTKMWKIFIDEPSTMVTIHGFVDGKKQEDRKEIKEGKNIGKSNATTPYQQACNNAQGKWNKKKDRDGYVENANPEEESVKFIQPMLANHYKSTSKSLKMPCYVSPKLDGVRNIADKVGSSIICTSRKGVVYTTLDHLHTNMSIMIDSFGKPLDGEAYKHGLSLQQISGSVKKEKANTPLIEYWLFDIVDADLNFNDRYAKISAFFDENSDGVNDLGFRTFGQIVEVPNELVNNHDELEEKHKVFVSKNFEGTMIRNVHGKYKIGHRTSDLLKRKDFLEEEFLIVGGYEATGSDAGTVVFTCRVNGGTDEFDVRPKGSREDRAQMLENLSTIKGKWLTVRFQMKSDTGIPCQLRGMCIRDYE